MNRRLIAWLSLVIFCLVGVAASTLAIEHLNFYWSLLLSAVFTAGFFICMEFFRRASWEYFSPQDKDNG